MNERMFPSRCYVGSFSFEPVFSFVLSFVAFADVVRKRLTTQHGLIFTLFYVYFTFIQSHSRGHVHIFVSSSIP